MADRQMAIFDDTHQRRRLGRRQPSKNRLRRHYAKQLSLLQMVQGHRPGSVNAMIAGSPVSGCGASRKPPGEIPALPALLRDAESRGPAACSAEHPGALLPVLLTICIAACAHGVNEGGIIR